MKQWLWVIQFWWQLVYRVVYKNKTFIFVCDETTSERCTSQWFTWKRHPSMSGVYKLPPTFWWSEGRVYSSSSTSGEPFSSEMLAWKNLIKKDPSSLTKYSLPRKEGPSLQRQHRHRSEDYQLYRTFFTLGLNFLYWLWMDLNMLFVTTQPTCRSLLN
jgi:hypothetical protein